VQTGPRFTHRFQPSVCIRLYNKIFQGQAEVIRNNEDENFRSIRRGEAPIVRWKWVIVMGMGRGKNSWQVEGTVHPVSKLYTGVLLPFQPLPVMSQSFHKVRLVLKGSNQSNLTEENILLGYCSKVRFATSHGMCARHSECRQQPWNVRGEVCATGTAKNSDWPPSD
jgi:hypothetical protein